MDDDKHFGRETLGVRGGQRRSSESENAEPIFTSSSFVFESAEQARARFANEETGNIYSRFSNPTVATFERRLAAMEGAESCLGTASGMSAILCACMSLLQSGDHIVCSGSVFGSTVVLLNNYFVKFGVSVSYVPLTDTDAWREAIRSQTRLLFLETPSNPLTEVADLPLLAELAREKQCLLVVDNCFCTPVLQQPLALGADIVIHSATKYLDGQGRCVGGAVVGSEEMIEEKMLPWMRSAGGSMSPFNAWVFLKGLETLSVRMRAHCESAKQLALWLQKQAGVHRVFYPGLEDHPQHELATRQQSDFGGIVSFEVDGGQADAWRVIDSTRLLSITANLGDTKSTITHPATTTHGRLSQQERDKAGISDALVRVSVGLETLDDIKADLKRGL